MSVKLKPITTTSWLVINEMEDSSVGLLSEIRDQYVLMVKGTRKKFLDRREVNTYFNENVFENVIEPKKEGLTRKDFFINGFPIDFENPVEVIAPGINLPLYSKKSTSEVYYCAGYYCLQFPKNWMPAYCPKLSTIQTYKYEGPFKTELEMKMRLQKLRKESK